MSGILSLSTFFAFALPGQFVMTETLLSGGNLLNVFFAVLFTNARLFPMTMHIIPTIKTNKVRLWKYFILCHFIAVTAWINYQINTGATVTYSDGTANFTGFKYSSAKCKRDVGYIVDAWINDLSRGGNIETR